jgi:hypothetical protein
MRIVFRCRTPISRRTPNPQRHRPPTPPPDLPPDEPRTNPKENPKDVTYVLRETTTNASGLGLAFGRRGEYDGILGNLVEP